MNLAEILSKFGNASYSPAFWKRVNRRVKEEAELFEKEEKDSKVLARKNLNKWYGA